MSARGIGCVGLGALVGCSGAPAAEQVEIPRPVAVAAPSASAVIPEAVPEVDTCTIVGRGGGDEPEVSISQTAALDDVVAILDPGAVDVAWSDLDVVAERAAIEIQSGPVRLRGWATTQRVPFHLRARTDVRTRHLYLVRGSAIDRPEGVAGGKLRFRARTGFQEPDHVVVQTECDNLSYGATGGPPDPTPSGGRSVVADQARLELHESPGSPAFLVATLRGREPLFAFEEEAGFVHVIQRPTAALVLDAWVPEAELAAPDPRVAHGRLAGCKEAHAPVVRFQRQPVKFASITTDAELRPAPDAKVVGKIVAGTEVRVGAEEGPLVAVDPYQASVRPPKKSLRRFLIPHATLGPVRDEMVDCRSADCEDFVRPGRQGPAAPPADAPQAKPCARDR